jgi:hypothetical protein
MERPPENSLLVSAEFAAGTPASNDAIGANAPDQRNSSAESKGVVDPPSTLLAVATESVVEPSPVFLRLLQWLE